MTKKCSVCNRPRTPEYHAFCSAICRDKDLLAWGNDEYVLDEDPDLKVDNLFSEDLRENSLDS